MVATPYETAKYRDRPSHMGWLPLVGSLKLQVSFAKEPFKRDCNLSKIRMILRSLLIVATPYTISHRHMNESDQAYK